MLNLKIFRFLAVSIVFLTIIFSVNSSAQDKSNSKCGEADYDAQIAEANKGIEFSIYNIEAYMARGIAYFEKNKYDEAVKDFNRASEINPRDDRAFYYRGKIYALRGNYDKAILDLSMAVEINPRNDSAYSALALSYDFKNETALAIENYSKAIALNPESTHDYYNRGMRYNSSGNKVSAKQDFSRAFDIINAKFESIPKECRSYIYYKRATIAYALGNRRQALADSNSAIDLGGFDEAYLFRGYLYFDNKNYKEAIADFTKSIELVPQWASVYKKRAEAYEKIGELGKAEADRKKYEELRTQP